VVELVLVVGAERPAALEKAHIFLLLSFFFSFELFPSTILSL
jgi:hypothetical protein